MLNFLITDTKPSAQTQAQKTLQELTAYRNEEGQGFNDETLQAFYDGLMGRFVCAELDRDE